MAEPKYVKRTWRDKAKLPAYLALAIYSSVGFYVGERNDNKIERTARESAYAVCNTGNETRHIISDLLALAVETPGPTDYTKLSTWPSLPPTIQQFLLELRTNSAGRTETSADQFRLFASEQLAPRDCTQILHGGDIVLDPLGTLGPATTTR